MSAISHRSISPQASFLSLSRPTRTRMESTAVSHAHSVHLTIIFRSIIANYTTWLESELYTILALAFTCIFYDGDPAKSFPLRQAARNLSQQLGKLVEFNVQCVNTAGFVASIVDRLHKHDARNPQACKSEY